MNDMVRRVRPPRHIETEQMIQRGGWTLLIVLKLNELHGEEGGPSSSRRKQMNYVVRRVDPPRRIENE